MWAYWADAQNASLDYKDYPPAKKRNPKKRYDSATVNFNSVKTQYDANKRKFDKDCK